MDDDELLPTGAVPVLRPGLLDDIRQQGSFRQNAILPGRRHIPQPGDIVPIERLPYRQVEAEDGVYCGYRMTVDRPEAEADPNQGDWLPAKGGHQ